MSEINEFYYNKDKGIIEINGEEINCTGIYKLTLVFENGLPPKIEIMVNSHEAIRRREE